MKLFVYEHITSGALIDQSMPDSLAQEGNDMLLAILQDCHAIDTLDVTILRDSRLSIINILNDARHHCHFISTREEYTQLWQQCLIEADAVFIIAPETDGVLYQLQQQAFALNKDVLGCQPKAIALSSDKFRCDKQLKEHGIDTAESCLASQWHSSPFDSTDGYILKSIDGAGCINTLYFESATPLEHHLLRYDNDTLQSHMVQAYIKGDTLSLSLLMDNDDAVVLSINKQTISHMGNALSLTACTVNDLTSHAVSLSQAKDLVRHIQRTISGLWGFVGIDFILSDKGMVIIDINPRLTTSYIGLKQSLGLNPFALLLTLSEHGTAALPPISQRQRTEIKL